MVVGGAVPTSASRTTHPSSGVPAMYAATSAATFHWTSAPVPVTTALAVAAAKSPPGASHAVVPSRVSQVTPPSVHGDASRCTECVRDAAGWSFVFTRSASVALDRTAHAGTPDTSNWRSVRFFFPTSEFTWSIASAPPFAVG